MNIYYSNFYNENGFASDAFKILLQITKINLEGRYHISSINKAIKKAGWINEKRLERWDIAPPPELKAKEGDIIDACHIGLKMGETIYPSRKKYDGILFLGAAFFTVVNRWKFYKQMIQDGKLDTIQELWILTGDRNLNEKAGETIEAMSKIIKTQLSINLFPKNELEMIKYVINSLGTPNGTRVKYINSEKEKNHFRATTFSTMVKFIELEEGQKSNFAAISNQPYALYQLTALKMAEKKLGRKFIIEPIGSKAIIPKDKHNYVAVLLDTVAKISRNLEQLRIGSQI
jgi:hypothetical protein